MNKLKIALASVIVAGSLVATSAPALAAPVSPIAINQCKVMPTSTKSQILARLNCYFGLISIKYPNILNITR